jgi:hypothetical protein
MFWAATIDFKISVQEKQMNINYESVGSKRIKFYEGPDAVIGL